MSNRSINTHRRAMRPVTPAVRIGRNAAGAAITAGLLVGGSSVALADGQAPAGAESTGVTAAPQTAPAVAIPSASATASPTAYGAGIESAAASLSIKAKPVEKPKPVEKTEKAAATQDDDTASASRGTSRSAAQDDDDASPSSTSSSSKKSSTTSSSDSEKSSSDSSSSDDSESTSSSSSSSKKSSTKAAAQESSDEAPASAASGSSIVDTARSGIGTPYVYGGSTRSGWDCSGFTSWVYAQHGISLPHSASAQKAKGTVISKSEARPGDLVYTPGHVGIYAGNGTIIDAGNSKKDTSERKMWSASWTYVRIG